MLPALERERDVLAPTLAGHAGGPPIAGDVDDDVLADAVEAAMDDAGFDTADIAGNSLGGYVALQLAARGRARSVVALAPAGGWAEGDESFRDVLASFETLRRMADAAAPHADAIAATPEGRRRATELIASRSDHLPADLVAHLIRGVAGCTDLQRLVEYAGREGWPLDPAAIGCPVRIVWGTADRVLPWPSSAARFQRDWLPHADWVELDGAGHCPQLDRPLEVAQLILGFTGR